MRILHLTHSLDPALGGTSEALRQVVQAVGDTASTPRLQHQVLSLDRPDAPWLADFPAPVHAIGPAGRFGWTPRLLPWLRSYGSEHDAWVVHGLWQYPGLAARHAARALALPYFVVPHGMLDPWFKRRYPLKHLKKWLYWPWGEYRVLRDARAVLFASEEEARAATGSFWLYRARPAVVGLGLALDGSAQASTPDAFLQAFPTLQGCRLVLFLGRLHPKKGCDLLLEAFADVAAGNERVRLVMAGPDSAGEAQELHATASRLGIAHRVVWTGMLQGTLKWSALRAAEVFVLPSHQENFGIAVVEALASGTPVIVSERVNIWREIVTGGAGWAGPDTAQATAAMLQASLALTPDQRAAVGARAQDCFLRCFQRDAVACRWSQALAGSAE
jgi:glycosyltransferase involved in cell wall biosynthesis